MERKETLRAALAAHRPHDPAERAFRDDTLALVGAAGDPFDRGRFDPGHVTASGFVLSPSRDRLLLLHHAVLDRWLQPGGHVEPGDGSVAAAAAREVLEETGVVVDAFREATLFDVDVHAIPALRGMPGHRHFDVRYLWVAQDERLERSKETLDVAWIALDEIDTRLQSPSAGRVRSKLAIVAETRLE